jgi:hypothetical protein
MEEDLRINIHFEWNRNETIQDVLLAIENEFRMPALKRSKTYVQLSDAPALEIRSSSLVVTTDNKKVIMLHPLNEVGERQASALISALAQKSPSFTHVDAFSQFPSFKEI